MFFTIDDYDRSLRLHSPELADPKVTARVMTVMLANEYGPSQQAVRIGSE